MAIRVISILIFSLILTTNVVSQGIDNYWITGYGNGPKSIINFISGSATTSLEPADMEFASTHANISDSAGNLLFYTNGVYIANALHDTMQNGSGLNPSQYTTSNSDGLHLRQANIIIPKPDDSKVYYLFHTTIDTMSPTFLTLNLFKSEIDISKNSGLGEVTVKNDVVISDNLNVGKLAAVKHGNGRDYWLVLHKRNTNIYYKVLITPNGVSSITTQSIGVMRDFDAGQVSFSTDGSKYAYYFYTTGLEIFDFDRCTGMFSNPVFIDMGTSSGEGVAFSPDNSKLYVSATDSLFQFDLNAANIEASKITVAVWDSFYYTIGMLSLPTWFELMALSPDGKIYITTGNGTQQMHIIDQPDSLGTACNVLQHALQLPTLYFNTLPNHPNYHLGPLLGSICDTVYTGIPPPEERLTLKLYPNPNSGSFQITYTPLPENLQLIVFNILGEEVHSQLLPQWSQLQNLHIGNLPAGVYMATITSSASSKSIKFIVQE